MVRYNFLMERLRNRQITMEEATELFGIMQGMIRASEAARLAAAAATAAPPAEGKPHPPAPKKTAGAEIPLPDDLLAAGILALGAGAGILAAITKRMAESAPPPARGRAGTSDGRSSTR